MDVTEEIPEHDYRSYYSPTYRLELPSAIMEDNNSEESLAAVREAALRSISEIPVRASPAPAAPPATTPEAAAETESAAEVAAAPGTVNEAAAAAGAEAADDNRAEGDAAAPQASSAGPESAGEAMDVADPMITDEIDAMPPSEPATQSQP